MQRLTLTACIILCYCSLHGGQITIVHSIHINGNHSLAERRLLDAMTIKPNAFFSRSQLARDVESLLHFYNQNGFYFVQVSVDSLGFSSDSISVDIVFKIAEGEQLEVGAIHLEGNTVLTTDDILQQFDTRAGRLFDTQILEHDINALLSRYERIGYPFARIEVQNVTPVKERSSTTLTFELSIDEGSKVQINEVRVTGNKVTNENVIVRETRIKSGELFDQEKLAKIRQRLNRLNIFSTVNEPELYMNATGGGVLIMVQEGNTNTFDGVIGYAPAGSTGGEGTLTGLVNVSMRNLFGTARKLHIQWLKDDTHSQEVALQYIEPWVFDLPVNLSGELFQRQQDSTYVRRWVEAKADLLVTESFSIAGLFNHESVIPSSTTSIQIVSNSRIITTGIGINYDSRDDILSPTGGVNYRSDYRIGNKKIFGLQQQGNETHTVQKVSLDADFFVEPISRQVVAIGLHGRQLTSDQIELSDLYRFGGTTTLRGYRENQFLGSRIAWTNTEYRFLLARHSFFYGFFDSGYYFLPSDDVNGISSTQHLKYGYGIGIRLETSLGNIGVSIALGEGDSFTQAKLHIGLINDF